MNKLPGYDDWLDNHGDPAPYGGEPEPDRYREPHDSVNVLGAIAVAAIIAFFIVLMILSVKEGWAA